MALAACLGGCTAAAPKAPSDVNAADARAIQALGVVEGKPIDTGFVFIDGRFIDAPYTVSRRGRQVFINDVLVLRDNWWPMPNLRVDEDPGPPPASWAYPRSFYDFGEYEDPDPLKDPAARKLIYLYQHFPEDVARQKMAEYYLQVPGVVSAIPDVVTTRAGDQFGLQLDPPWVGDDKENIFMRKEVSEEALAFLDPWRQDVEARLKEGQALFLSNLSELFMAVDRDTAARDLGMIVQILRSSKPRQQKISLLQRMKFLGPTDETSCAAFWPLITRFQASHQLDERLAPAYAAGVQPLPPPGIPDVAPPDRVGPRLSEAEYEKEFGAEEGKPVSKGFAFINGRYLEPPYTVSRRGISMYINGIKVWDWPVGYLDVDKEPGPPPGATKDWRLGDLYPCRAWDGDRWDLKEVRWTQSHFQEAEADRRIIEYYRNLPFIRSVEVKEPGHLVVEDFRGDSESVYLGLPPPGQPAKEALRLFLTPALGNIETWLDRGACFFYFTDCDEILLEPYKAATCLGVMEEVLSSNRSAAEKEALLRGVYLQRKDEAKIPRLVAGFQGSKFLAGRIAEAVKEQKATPLRLEDLSPVK